MRSWRLQEHRLKNLLPNWILRMWVVAENKRHKGTGRNSCLICSKWIRRRDATSKVFQKLRRKTSRKCFPPQTPKVRSSAEHHLRCILGPSAAFDWLVLVPQLCPCWTACCCWTRRAGPQLQRPSRCLTSLSLENQRKRRKHSCTTTR